ncbi:L-alanine-DL-glutamate epimerase [Saccharopolyspora shandongensis]|uniref:L-alanine-DL-glutamate epimerase n=1 Tax=Saccharopolyspora shandongensis TaxID=418495 RepID=A0A1H3G3X5_9PSEU|nr:enolase C-terminal domain-like protein [Saccharopolyspora shandongensis]SDX97951.1 L-alanine-DL-glutamate epimerase [Saccharopolyspora shandongensis]
MTPLTIERLEITEVREGVSLGDDSFFVIVHGAGAVGCYGPVGERIAVYARGTVASVVKDASVADHIGLLERMRAAARTTPSDIASWAVGAVDCAVWDLHGRLASRSVAALLTAQKPRSSVPAYASWLSQDLTSVDDLDVLRRAAADDWCFTKWGLRGTADDAPDRAATRMARAVERCAQAVGTPLAVDAVGTWSPSAAMAFAHSVDVSCLLWLEDPLPHHDLHTYGLLAATGVPLAVGERAHCDEDPAGLIHSVSPRVLTLDVVGCGGLTRAVQILDVARSQAIPICPHGRSLVPGLHLAAAFPDAIPAVEYRLQWEPRRQRLYDVALQPEHGRVPLPDSPGLGTTPRSTACPARR